MTFTKKTILLAAVAVPFAANAQKGKDSVIHANTIEIIQSYKPEVKQAPKPEFTAGLPPADTSHPVVHHTVPAQTLYFSYHSLPLRPLALGRDTAAQPFANYVKLGGGNLSTFYLDAGVGSVKGENYESAFHAYHINQSGGIKGQRFGQTQLEGEGTLHTAGHALTAGVDIVQNSFHRYGYSYAQPSADYNPPASTLGGVRLRASAANETENDWGIRYKPEVMLSFMSGKDISHETKLGTNIPVSYDVDSFITLQASVSASYTALSAPGFSSLSTGMGQISPGIVWHKRGMRAHAILSPTLGQNGNAYVLPDLGISIHSLQNILDVAAGWKATLNQNSYESLYLVNPYIIVNPALNAQYRQSEVYGMASTNLVKHFFLQARVSYMQLSDMPLFVNTYDPIQLPGSMEVVQAASVKAITFQANARYQVGNSLAAGLSGTWINYYRSTTPQVWSQPGVKIKGDLMVRPIQPLVVTAYLAFLDEIYAVDEAGMSVKLKPLLDLGAGAEYQIMERLSAFIQVNNLLNNRNERWLYYPSFGFNVYGGLRFKF